MDSHQPSDHDRIIILETQVKRFISDIESEKGTRSRSNSDFKHDLDEIREAQKRSDKLLYAGLGGLAVLQLIIPIIVSFFTK